MNFAKIILIGVSVFLSVMGVILMGSTSVIEGNLMNMKLEKAESALSLTFWAGVFIILLGVFGVVGGVLENRFFVLLFIIMVGIVVVSQIIVLVLLFIFNMKKDEVIKHVMTEAIKDYNKTSEITESIDKLQNKFKCCGLTGPTDWKDHQYLTGKDDTPDSCCKNWETGCGKGMASTPSDVIIQTLGCTSPFLDFAGLAIKTLGFLLLIMIVVSTIIAVVAGMARGKFQ